MAIAFLTYENIVPWVKEKDNVDTMVVERHIDAFQWMKFWGLRLCPGYPSSGHSKTLRSFPFYRGILIRSIIRNNFKVMLIEPLLPLSND